MTDHIDAIDPVALLSSLRAPVGWNERTDVDTDPRAAALLERVTSGNVVPFRSPRRHLRIVTGVIVAASLGGLAAAALWERTPTEPQALTCWSEAVSPPSAQVGLGWDGQSDPVSQCTPAWNGGGLGAEGPPRELQVCVNDVGAAAVIPGSDDTCDTLGFANYIPLADGLDDTEALVVLEAEQLLTQRYNTGGCNSAAEVAAGVRHTLDEFALDHWVVVVADNFTERQSCATVAFDRPAATVFVVPGEPAPIVEEADSSDVADIVAAQARLDEVFGPTTCDAAEVARTETLDVLDAFGLGHWKITILDTFSADEPCARVALDNLAETASIVSAAPTD